IRINIDKRSNIRRTIVFSVIKTNIISTSNIGMNISILKTYKNGFGSLVNSFISFHFFILIDSSFIVLFD
ncbi:MAG: hypothetical protein ACW97X_07885, partial [Candidatus Hodarchaeales archaeon]